MNTENINMDAEQCLITFAKNVRYIREKKGYSRNDIFKALDINPMSQYNYETAKSKIGLSKAYQISKFFDVPLTDFLEKDLSDGVHV